MLVKENGCSSEKKKKKGVKILKYIVEKRSKLKNFKMCKAPKLELLKDIHLGVM